MSLIKYVWRGVLTVKCIFIKKTHLKIISNWLLFGVKLNSNLQETDIKQFKHYTM